MNRRHFLNTMAGTALAGYAYDGKSEGVSIPIDSLFDSDQSELLQLAQRVMEKCVLDKIRAPTPPLKNTWIAPGWL